MSSLSGESVLVTGGAGFIGSHLVDALLEAGSTVRVLDNFSTGYRANLEHCLGDIELIEGDLRSIESCQSATLGCSRVFHQAALGSVPRSMSDPASTIAVNVSGTANLFAACRDSGVSRVIYASSSSVYGDSTELPKAEGHEGRPLSPYAWSKCMNEDLAAAFGDAYPLEFVGLRYFNVYGARQSPDGPYAAVIPRFFRAVLESEEATIFGDGGQSRDFTAVSDAVRANLLAAEASEQALGRAFNVAGGKEVTVNDLLEAIGGCLDLPTAARFDQPRPGDVRHSFADLTAVETALGYRPLVDLARGLDACAHYYRELVEGESVHAV